MKTEFIDYHHEGAVLEAFVAFDEKRAKAPGVLIFHAWRGRDSFVLEKAKWLASLGYVGIALDLYGKGVLGSSNQENEALMEPFMKDRKFLLSRLRVGLDIAKQFSRVDVLKIGAIGFCFGGLCALDLARSGAPIKGVVSFHGLLTPPNYPCRPKGKILVLHGNDDPMVPSHQVQAFEEEMTQAGADWQVHAYGKTMHAFTNPLANDQKMGTVYHPLAEKRSFQAMTNFFDEIFFL